MINKTVSHYRIIEELGCGGMGEVYLAHDTDLDRKVALKFLPLHYTKDKEINKRFKREAQAAAALNHPNIITIHEIGEFEGHLYITMEYVEGESLREIVGAIRESPLQIDNIIDYATQICEGLHEAHQAGIVHRDIKPENILIDKSGRVKILDFGLARMKGVTRLTKDASTLGTLKYMSPEQYQNKEVDHRTDIWSLGIVMFEMLVGQVPFCGEYEAAVMYSVVNEEPRSVSSIRKDTPQNLEQIVGKSLEKDPAMRYQSMGDMLQELKGPTVDLVKPMVREKSIIVLPFRNMSPDPEQEYFSDGLTEEIITDLSHIHDLLVISSTSAMMLKGTKKDIKTIGRELNVQYVLEGSVRKAGNNLRITAQLIEASVDKHLWAEKYSGTLDDVFDIQGKVSRSIVDALKVKLSPEENKNISERPIMDAEAYELFLRARKETFSFTEEGLERALQLINNGLSIIGDNELLYGIMGWTYFQYFNFGIKKEERFLRKVEECADKVFALNPNSYMGHYLRAILHWKNGNIQDAIIEFKTTLELNPNHIDSLIQISYFYAISGKSYAARPWLNRLLEIAPLDSLAHFAAGWAEFAEGNFNNGFKSLSKMYKIDPEIQVCRLFYGHGLAYVHKFGEAYELLDLFVKESPQTWLAQFSLFFKYALQNKKTDALQAVSENLKKTARRDEYFPLLMAEGYALIDEKDEAIDWLEEVVKWGFINYPFLNKYDPFLENIRGEERFKKLMKRVKREWENFKV